MLVSENGVSLVLGINGFLGGYLGHIPVMWDARRAEFIEIIEGQRVSIQPVDG
jgi:hypothetical protein